MAPDSAALDFISCTEPSNPVLLGPVFECTTPRLVTVYNSLDSDEIEQLVSAALGKVAEPRVQYGPIPRGPRVGGATSISNSTLPLMMSSTGVGL
ncbi:hypothetical protein PG997_006924 [Apiospora hydei]|uniref:Uncharacterized protein n=1 Tax=Apiospora hydei TaxID=1337664 RepID=A0ABR1WS92_9PEZI